jgi:hypothetical protein
VSNGHRQQFTLAGTASGFHRAAGDVAQIPAEIAQWSVSDPKLGTIDEHGQFTAADNGGGLVTITA